jgi:hypothetical protein
MRFGEREMVFGTAAMAWSRCLSAIKSKPSLLAESRKEAQKAQTNV